MVWVEWRYTLCFTHFFTTAVCNILQLSILSSQRWQICFRTMAITRIEYWSRWSLWADTMKLCVPIVRLCGLAFISLTADIDKLVIRVLYIWRVLWKWSGLTVSSVTLIFVSFIIGKMFNAWVINGACSILKIFPNQPYIIIRMPRPRKAAKV